MFEEGMWNKTLAAARAGDRQAADSMADWLIAWAAAHVREPAWQDSEDFVVSFVEHITQDRFAHAPEGPPAAIAAYLLRSLKNFRIDWYRREIRWKRMEVLGSDLIDPERENEERPDMDTFAGSNLNPENTVMDHALIEAVQETVRHFSRMDQAIFRLRVGQQLPEVEIARQLGMSNVAVRKHLHHIRRRLEKWKRESWD